MRADASPCPYCKTIIESILSEEQIHLGELEYALDILELGDSKGRGEGALEAHNLIYVDEPSSDDSSKSPGADKSTAQFDEPYVMHTDYP
jgi:hypothetical protein